MNNILQFQNQELGNLRIIMINQDPWFIVTDICKILKIKNSTTIISSLEKYDKDKFILELSVRPTNIISESGFYTIVLKSRKPNAKKLCLWVACDVLPKVRKAREYIPIKINEEENLIMAKALKIADNIMKRNASIDLNRRNNPTESLTEKTDCKPLSEAKETLTLSEISHFFLKGVYYELQYRIFKSNCFTFRPF